MKSFIIAFLKFRNIILELLSPKIPGWIIGLLPSPNPLFELDDCDDLFLNLFVDLKFWANLIRKLIVFQRKQNLAQCYSHVDDYFNIYVMLFYVFTTFNGTYLEKFGPEMKSSQSQKKFCCEIYHHMEIYVSIYILLVVNADDFDIYS